MSARSLRNRADLQQKAAEQHEQTLSRAFEGGVLLAHVYEKEKPQPNPKGWWVSEKLDGVRAYWNGRDFYSRSGNLYYAPDFFKQGLPKDHLDGEIWCGRQQFEKCVGIVRTTMTAGARAEQWRELRFLVFDAPVVAGKQDLSYEARVEAAKTAVKDAPYAEAVSVERCQGRKHMDGLLRAVIANGGEGLMLREPGSYYERTRSHSLLKVKTMIDGEARVVGHSKDSKLPNVMGALECEMPVSKVRFKVGTGFSKPERQWSRAKQIWPVGTVITYKYQGLTVANGKPRFSAYVRIRGDKTWQQVEADSQADLDAAAALDLTAAASHLPAEPSLLNDSPLVKKISPKRTAEAPAEATITGILEQAELSGIRVSKKNRGR